MLRRWRKGIDGMKAKTGRPSLYSDKLAASICEQLAAGRSLTKICAGPGMPGTTTVFRWIEEKPEFRDRYARAREFQADIYADQIIDIADDAEDANLARVQIDARKWTASKLRPNRYGDRITQEHTGPKGGPVQQVEYKLTEDDMQKLLDYVS